MFKKYVIKPLILFLVLSQFATIAHAVEHQLVDEDIEQCLICLHETESKNLIAATSNPVGFNSGSYAKITSIPCTYYSTEPSLYNIRSPPTSLA